MLLGKCEFCVNGERWMPSIRAKGSMIPFLGIDLFFEGFGMLSGHVSRLGIVEPISVFITYQKLLETFTFCMGFPRFSPDFEL